MKKRIVLIAAVLILAAVAAGCFAACGDPDYFKNLDAYEFWDNEPEEAIAQPKIGQMVRDFLFAPSADGKTKKVAFIGYDGCRADALINVLDTPDKIGGDNSTSLCSGIAEVLKGEDAGIYYAYAGGETELDIIFGIYEGTDHNGHGTGFGNGNYKYIKGFRDEDAMAFELLQAIYSRPSYEQEDWLIIITTDHGGRQTWHGNQTYEERSTWVVCNKGIDAKYFGSGYDGYTENV